jgi:hypothetical protein
MIVLVLQVDLPHLLNNLSFGVVTSNEIHPLTLVAFKSNELAVLCRCESPLAAT